MAQSITFNGSSQYTSRTLANSGPYTSLGSWRLEMRLTDIGAGTSQKIVDNSHFYIKINASTGTLTIFSWDSEITDTTLDVNGFSSHLSDITIRVQRDVSNSRYTIEAWDSNTATRFASSTGLATSMSNRNFGNDKFYVGARSIENSGSAGEYFNGRIAFARWYATLVNYDGVTKPTLYSNPADLLQMEYEGNLNDSSSNAQNFTGTGSPTFNTTPTINPIANAGADVGGRIAGVTFSLNAGSSSAGDAGPITSYSWTRISGSGTISSPSSATTNITGIGSGESVFQVEVGDGTNTSTDTVTVGVISVNADGTVQISDAATAIIIGPQIPYGSTASLVLPYYDANMDEGYAIKRNLPSVAPRVDPAGTLAVTNGSPNVVGTSTRFTKELALQSPGGLDIPLRISGVNYIISSVTDDTHLTLTTNYTGSTTSGITNWDQDSGAEASDLFTSYWHYYDAALNAYISYYRTGLTKWLTEARRLADARWSAVPINYGATDPASGNSPREAALGGVMVRALDGKPEYWDYCYRYVTEQLTNWVTARKNYRGLYFGLRDGGYALLFATWLSQGLPDTYTLYGNGTTVASTGTATDGATKRAAVFAEVLDDAVNLYCRLQRADGSWRWGQDETNTLATGGITSSATSFSLSSDPGGNWRTSGDLKIENEYLSYTGRSGASITGVTRGKYGTTAVSHSAGAEVSDLVWGYMEQVFHVGVGVGNAFVDILRIIEGNATYQAEYSTIRQCLIANAAHGMLMGYSTAPVTDTPSINSRFMVYGLHSWDESATKQEMPDTIRAWATIADLRDARQNVVTWTQVPAGAYHYSGVSWFRDQADELLSANWGKTGYEGTIGTSDGYYGLQDYFAPSNNRRMKEYNEWHRQVGRAFAQRYIAPEVPANLPPLVTAGRDRILANGTSSPSFTARAIDPAGGSLTYQWTAAMGTSLTLSGATTATVTVTSTLADNSDYGLRVAVTNSAGKTTYDWVMFRTRDPVVEAEQTPPVANVSSQNVSVSGSSSSSALDASGSTAFGGRTVHYRWFQTSGAAGTISNPRIANPTLSGLTTGTYTYRVFVYDNLTRTTEEPGVDAVDVRVVVSGGSNVVVRANLSMRVI